MPPPQGLVDHQDGANGVFMPAGDLDEGSERESRAELRRSMHSYFWRSFHRYRSGLLGRTKPAANIRKLDHPFTVLLGFQTTDLVPMRQRLLKRRVNRSTFDGLQLSREGQLQSAREKFERGLSVMSQMEAGPGRYLVEAFHEAAWAYLDYREGCPERALQRVSHALDLDRLLEREYGFGILQLHRVQLAHNHSRVGMRFGPKDKALKLCGELMNYLVAGPPPSFDKNWDREGLQSIPLARRAGMLDQVGSESICQLVVSSSDEYWQTFYKYFGRPWPESTRVGLSSSRALRWFEAKDAQLNGDLYRYFELFDSVVAEGVGNQPGLFFGAMLDFARLCRNEGPSEVLDWVLKDSRKWKGVPAFLRAALEVLEEETLCSPAGV